MKSIIKNIGTITLGQQTHVTDPCLEPGSFYGAIVHTAPGQWNCRVRERSYGSWGRRVSVLEARLKGFRGAINEDFKGALAVDSGQIGVFDEPYYTAHQGDDDWDDPTSWYRRVSDMTASDARCGTIDGSCAVSESGIGDGYYFLQVARNAEGLVVGMRIRFI